MDIFEARNAQKYLYKNSESPRKMGIDLKEEKGEFEYYVTHKLDMSKVHIFDSSLLTRLIFLFHKGMKFGIFAVTQDMKKNFDINMDVGLYMVDIIPVD